MLERILLIIKSKNLTASKFADEIGVQRSGISHILSGRNKPSLELIQKILSHFPDLRTEWLMNGTGQMYKELQLFGGDILTPKDLNKSEIKEMLAEINDTNELMDDIIEEKHEEKPVENQQIAKQTMPSTPSKDKSIEKILVFYSDKTFSEYKPE